MNKGALIGWFVGLVFAIMMIWSLYCGFIIGVAYAARFR